MLLNEISYYKPVWLLKIFFSQFFSHPHTSSLSSFCFNIFFYYYYCIEMFFVVKILPNKSQIFTFLMPILASLAWKSESMKYINIYQWIFCPTVQFRMETCAARPTKAQCLPVKLGLYNSTLWDTRSWQLLNHETHLLRAMAKSWREERRWPWQAGEGA